MNKFKHNVSGAIVSAFLVATVIGGVAHAQDLKSTMPEVDSTIPTINLTESTVAAFSQLPEGNRVYLVIADDETQSIVDQKVFESDYTSLADDEAEDQPDGAPAAGSAEAEAPGSTAAPAGEPADKPAE